MVRPMHMLNKIRSNIIPVAAYSLLSVILTYPVAFSGDLMPGDRGDGFQYLWFFWWFKKAILSMNDPYFTNYIYYPDGVSMVFSDIGPLNAIASIPLQMAFGLITAYKIIWLFTFILSGCSMFLLANYLIADKKVAFVSGLIFMFCPYHFAHALGHMNLISIEWIPLYVLFLIRTVKESNKSNPVYAALFLLLNATSSLYYLMYMIIFTLFILVYHQIVERSVLEKSVFERLGIMIISFSLAASPLMYRIARELFTARSNYMYTAGFVEYSADLLAFFTPTSFHPLFKELTGPINSCFTGGPAEFTVFAGYTVMLLSCLAVYKIKRTEIKFWAISAGIFFLLSLGPLLHVKGLLSIVCEGINVHIPLPYLILMRLPIFSLLRVTSRWDLLLMLCLALLAGYGIKYILDNYGGHGVNRRNIILLLISCLVIFEFLSVPYPLSETKVPEFYEQLAADKEDYAIMEIPSYATESLYYQTIHQKKLIGGYLGRAESKEYPPFINLLMSGLSGNNQDILAWDRGAAVLNDLHIKYIVLHTELMSEAQLEFVRSLLKRSIKEGPRSYGSLEVFEINGQPEGESISLNTGWYGRETWNDTSTRWMGEEASVTAVSKEAKRVELSLVAQSFIQPRILEIYVNGTQAGQVQINSSEFIRIMVHIELKKGANLILLRTAENCERPSDIPSIKSGDNRCLSLAIQNISIDWI